MFKKLKRAVGLGKKAPEYFVYKTENGVAKAIQFLAKSKLKRQGGPQGSHDWLLAGRQDKFAEATFGVQFNRDGTINNRASKYPWIGLKIEESLRLPYHWLGRLPNGMDPYWVGYRHFDNEAASAMIRKAAVTGVKAAGILATLAFVAGVGTHLDVLGVGWPIWNLGSWVFDLPTLTMIQAIASGAAVWSVDAIGKVVELMTNGAGVLVTCAALSAALFVASLPAATLLALNKAMGRYKEQIIGPLAVPTKDSLYRWRNLKSDLALHMKTYAEAALNDVERREKLNKLPVIKLAIASGLMASRGLIKAPVKGSALGWDGESMRTHGIIFGKTGRGKTLRFLRKIFRRTLNADWGEDHTLGAVIFDGKGELPFDLREEIPAHRLKDFVLVGTEDGAFGLDLLAGMTPPEVADAFQLVAKQVNGVSSEGAKWINGAAEAIKYAAFLAQYLLEHASSKSSIWENRNYTPYSLLGLMAIATEEKLNIGISDSVLEAHASGRKIDSYIVEAARFFAEVWKGYAPETRSSYQSNISDTLGKLSGTGRLAERFASGPIEGVHMANLEQAFDEGKIFGIGLSQAADGEAGLIVANLAKTRLYILAQRRTNRAAKAREMLARIKDCAENYDNYHMRQAMLSKLDVRLQLAAEHLVNGDKQAAERKFAEAGPLFAELFPDRQDVSIGDIAFMQRVRKDEDDSIRMRLLGFTPHVMSIAHPNQGGESKAMAKMAGLQREAVLTKKTSCMCMIDEYQNFATVGGGGTGCSSFLNVARSTGLFVIAATQSVHALNMTLGFEAAKNIMNNFVSKFFFQTSDPETHQYIIEMGESGWQSMTYAPNLRTNFTQVLDDVSDEWVEPPSITVTNALWPSLRLTVDDRHDTFVRQVDEIDLGTKGQIDDSSLNDERQGINEIRNRLISKEDAMREEIRAGEVRPYVTVSDLEGLSLGYAYCIIDRGGMPMKDFAFFDIGDDD